MRRRAYFHSVITDIEKQDKIMKRRLNVGTGRKDRKKILEAIRKCEENRDETLAY